MLSSVTGTPRDVKHGFLVSSWLRFSVLAEREAARKRGTDCTFTDGLVALSVRPQIRTAQRGSIWISWTLFRVATTNLSSLPTAGLTCLLHLQFHVLQKQTWRVNYAIAATLVPPPGGLMLMCRGSNFSPLVIIAHRMRAFLLAMATAAFCQPDFSRRR